MLEPVDQSAFVDGDADVYPQSIGSLRRDFVLLTHGLHAAHQVTARPLQFRSRIVHFVLMFLLMGRRQD